MRLLVLLPSMAQTELYPLKFDPIYQYRIWGGRRLSNLLSKPLPADEPIGEAWILSDRDDHPSKVINGKLKGKTIAQLTATAPEQLLGALAGKFDRFPLLLKFLDCKKVLSVQVHPSDQLKKYIPKGEHGKTEAWVVLEAGNDAIIYAGLAPGTNEQKIKDDLQKNEVAADLASFKPKTGDAVLIEAGTVHTLADAVVFEVQENSDVTYRLYDWDRVDEKTGKPRDLQLTEALACIDFSKIAIKPLVPVIVDEGLTESNARCEKLINDTHFKVWRLTSKLPFMVGKTDTCRILVNIEGDGELDYKNSFYSFGKGEVMLLPASVGACPFVPKGKVVLLEVALPQG